MGFWGLLLGIAVGILVLMVLVVIHEFGHFLAAKKSGVKVEEFGIGFPPKIWSCQWGKRGSGQWLRRNDVTEDGVLENGGWIFSINFLPIGGFCRMQGEADAAKGKGDYGSASFGKKTLILFGGVMANFLAAIVIFTILALFGIPKVFDNQFTIFADTHEQYGEVLVATVVENSPAATAGIKVGDKIRSIAETNVDHASQVSQLTREHRGETIEITYTTETGERREVTTTLNSEGESGFLGVATYQNESLRATWSAPIVGVGTTVQFTYETVKGLGNLVGNLFGGIFKQFSADATTREAGQADIKATGDGLAGPIAIVGILLPEATKSGALYVLFVAGVISVSLAIMNLLPIPALDGGRWFLTAIFKFIKRPLTLELEGKINAIGFVFLMFLMVVMAVLDIGRLGGAG